MNYKNLISDDFFKIPRGGKITARRLDLDKRVDSPVYVFSERPNVYQCILSSDETVSKLPDIAGLLIKHEAYNESGNELKHYILLECSSPGYLKQFTEVIKDVVSEFDNGSLTMAECVRRVIAKWRHFLSEPRSQILDEEEILGLIGELVLLKQLIKSHGPDSVEFWKAEEGEEDFAFKKVMIEVKASVQERHRHVINGIDQLRVLPGFQKYLLSLLFIRSTEQVEITLPSLVGEITSDLERFPMHVDTFFQKLKVRGYDIRDSQDYEAFCYVYARGGYFRIDENFPKLTSGSFAAPLSARISKIRYTLDLEGLDLLDFMKVEIYSLANFPK